MRSKKEFKHFVRSGRKARAKNLSDVYIADSNETGIEHMPNTSDPELWRDIAQCKDRLENQRTQKMRWIIKDPAGTDKEKSSPENTYVLKTKVWITLHAGKQVRMMKQTKHRFLENGGFSRPFSKMIWRDGKVIYNNGTNDFNVTPE